MEIMMFNHLVKCLNLLTFYLIQFKILFTKNWMGKIINDITWIINRKTILDPND